jgi:hypothetical protein
MRTAKIRPEGGGRGGSLGFWRVIPPQRPTSGAAFRAPLYHPSDPGLKPWAVLYSRFAAKSYSVPSKRRFSHSHRLPADGEAWEKQGRYMPSGHLELDRPYILLAGPSDGVLSAPDAWNSGG